jgi:tetratricopeptide (TPR) repeat protein
MSHFLINKLPVTTHLKSQPWDKFGFLIGTMKNTVNKSIGIILPIVLFFLFSYASAQQKQDEPKDAKFYIDRGIAYGEKGQYDQAIADFNKALEIDPKSAGAYYNRGIAYYFKKEYDKSWKDINKAQDLGYKIPSKFLENLRNASGRKN